MTNTDIFCQYLYVAKSIRLIQIMHLLRMLPPPVAASRIAQEFEVSQRTVYRDIEALRTAGARIDGSPGYGYVLEEDPAIPALMFDEEQVEALVLGLREVIAVGDPVLARAAKGALAKLSSSLPATMERHLRHAVLHSRRFHPKPEIQIDVADFRRAIRAEQCMVISYTDGKGQPSDREIWPLAIVYSEMTLLVVTWCCLRQDFRSFRLDRIAKFTRTGGSFRPDRVSLLKDCFEALSQDRYRATKQGG